MSFFKALINLIFGRGNAQPEEQPKPVEPQPLPEGVEEIVPHSDPRVAAANGERGLVTEWIETEPNHYTLKFESGKETWTAGEGGLYDRIRNGITTVAGVPNMLRCVDDVRCGRDASMWTTQQIFDAKVYLGKIIIQRGN